MKKAIRAAPAVAGWLVTLAAIMAVLGALTLMVGPRLLGWQGVIVLTGSMEPALKVGGLAFMESESDPTTVKVGDIITFRSTKSPNRQISHRVIELINDDEGLRFRTKGDNSELPDQQLVPAGNLVGKVRFHLPYLGYAADKLRHRENLYLLLGIPAGLVIASELWNIIRELGKARRRKEMAKTNHRRGLYLVGIPAGLFIANVLVSRAWRLAKQQPDKERPS